MLQLNKLKSQASPYWDSLARVYHASFPIDEQRPIEDIARLIEEDARFVAYAITDEKDERDELNKKNELGEKNEQGKQHNRNEQITFVGLLTTWHFTEFIYIEHFAIAPDLRSQGYGAEALGTFIAEQQCPIILEAEPPTDDMALRRIGFYQRCGLTLYDYPYIQPAYTPTSNPVALRLMGTIDTATTPLAHVSKTLHREVYGLARG